MTDRLERKLTTILAADAEGYSEAMSINEEGTLSELRSARRVFEQLITRHSGRIANTAGDGLIAEFPSVVEAVRCAIEVQQELAPSDTQAGQSLRFRIGIHLGDVIIDGSDLLGEGVNLAARLQSMAPPGGVLVSQQVYDQVHSKLSVRFHFVGEKRPKNFVADVRIYEITTGQEVAQPQKPRRAVYRADPKPDPVQSQSRHEPDETEGFDADALPGYLKLLGLGAVFAFVIDILTGSGFWFQWPVLVAAMVFGMVAGPQLLADRFQPSTVRSGVLVIFLTMVNLFTWNGSLWVIYPAGAIIFLELARRIMRSQ